MSSEDPQFLDITAETPILIPPALSCLTASAVQFSFKFECLLSYKFTIAAAFTGASVEIKESAEGSFTDLEAGDYDMSAFAGLTKTFILQITPDDPRVVTRANLRLQAVPV